MKWLFLILILVTQSWSRPSWLDEPLAPLLHIGWAKTDVSPTLQKRLALMQVKSELSKTYQIQIFNELMRQTQCNYDQCRTQLHSKSVQKSHALMGTLKIIDSFTDTDNSMFYRAPLKTHLKS